MLTVAAVYGRRLFDIVLLTRPLNALSPLMLVGIGALLGGVAVTDSRVTVVMVAVLLLHGAVTMANDIEDIAIDRRNHVDTILTRGRVSPRMVQWWVVGQIALAGLLLAAAPGAIIGVVLFCLISWLYNARPWYWSRRPVLSIVGLALAYATLPVVIGAGIGAVTGWVLLVALAWGVVRASLSILKDYKDAVGDAKSNKRTFLLSYGHRRVRAVSVVAAVVGVVAVVGALVAYLHGWGDVRYAALVVAAGAAVMAWRLRLYRADSYTALNHVFRQCGWLHLVFDGVCLLWLIQSHII